MTLSKRGQTTTGVLGVMAMLLTLLVAVAAPAFADHAANDGLCPGDNKNAPHVPDGLSILVSNDDTESIPQSEQNETVLPAGTLVCVKGGDYATGIVVADGTKTLLEILNNGNGVSHYVVYAGDLTLDAELGPVVVDAPECGEVTSVTLPTTDGVEYSDDGEGTVTATPLQGYRLVLGAASGWELDEDGTAEYDYEYEDRRGEPCSPPPPPQVRSTVTVTDGEFECGDDAVIRTTTTTTTTTPFTFDTRTRSYVRNTAAETRSVGTSVEKLPVTEKVLEENGCDPIVLDVVLDKEPPAPAPDPVADPEPVVLDTAEELPATGATSDVLLIWAGALLALGCGLLLTDRRLAARARR